MKCIYEAAKKKLNLGDDPGIRKKEKKQKRLKLIRKNYLKLKRNLLNI